MIKSTHRWYQFVGGLALVHAIYTFVALLLTHRAMIIFSFGSVGFAYRTLLLSGQTKDLIFQWLKWAFWGIGGLALILSVGVLVINFLPNSTFLNPLIEAWSTMRALDFLIFFLLFGFNWIEEKKQQA